MTIIESLELGALFALSILARLQAPNKSTSSIACCANNQTIAKKQKINYHRPLCSKCNQHLVLSILLSTPPPPRLPFGLSFSPVHCHFFTISACSPSLSFPLSRSAQLSSQPSLSLSLSHPLSTLRNWGMRILRLYHCYMLKPIGYSAHLGCLAEWNRTNESLANDGRSSVPAVRPPHHCESEAKSGLR